MKKIALKCLSFIILTIALIALNATNSYAKVAQLEQNNTTSNVNARVSYKIKFKEKIITEDMELEYNNEYLEYLSTTTANTEVNVVNNKIFVLYSDVKGEGTDCIEILFKVKNKIPSNVKNEIKLLDINFYDKENKDYSSKDIDLQEFVKNIGANNSENINNNNTNNNNSNNNNNNNSNNSNKNNNNNSNSNNSNTSNKNNGNSNNNKTNQDNNVDQTKANGTIPQTGTSGIPYIVIGTLGLIILNAVFIIGKNKKIKCIIPMLAVGMILTGTLSVKAVNNINIKKYNKIKNCDKVIVIMPDKTNRNINVKEIKQISNGSKIRNIIRNDKNLEETSYIATKDKIIYEDGNTYTAIVYGDINCDGKVNSIDVAKFILCSLNNQGLDNIERKAINLCNENDEEDNNIDQKDFERLKEYILRKRNGNIVDKLPQENSQSQEGTETKIPVNKVSLNKNTLTIYKGESENLIATVEPENATNKNVTWKSSNETIASVDQQGKVVAKEKGKSSITVTTIDGKISATCEIEVIEKQVQNIPVTGIKLNKTNTSLNAKETEKLLATIEPINATNQKIIWSSSDSSIITVDQNGIISAKGKPTQSATIIAKTEDGAKIANCIVNINRENVQPVVELGGNQIISTGIDSNIGIKITEPYIYNINSDKIKIEYPIKNEQKDSTGTKLDVTKENVNVSYTNENIATGQINIKATKGVGHFNVVIDEGFVTDTSGNTNKKVIYKMYVANLNTTSSENAIGATVDVANSFYLKNFKYCIDGIEKQTNTTNEYIYDGLNANKTYKIKVLMSIYENKETDNIFTGYIEKQVTTTASKGTTVHFIDVSHDVDSGNGEAGDCIFIKTGDGKTVLVDTGDMGNYSKAKQINQYLQTNKLVSNKTIDYLILTHPHSDHIGGYEGLVDTYKYKFNQIIVPCDTVRTTEGNSAQSKLYYRITEDAKKQNKLREVTAGNSIVVGNCVLNIFYPYPEQDIPNDMLADKNNDGIRSTTTYPDETTGKATPTNNTTNNNKSIVMKLICGSRKMLLTGDAEFYTEEILTGNVAKEISNSNEKGLPILNVNYADNKKEETTYSNLIKDIKNSSAYPNMNSASDIQQKYKFSRLTEKDISAQVLKKGHHHVMNSTTVEFLEKVKCNKIVSTGVHKGTKQMIKYVSMGPDYRIRKYYNSGKSGATSDFKDSNGKTHLIGTKDKEDKNAGKIRWYKMVFCTSATGNNLGFYITTENGTGWSYKNAYDTMKAWAKNQ